MEAELDGLGLSSPVHKDHSAHKSNLPGVYEPFDVVTSHALEHTLADHSIPFDERLIVQLMAAYNRLKEWAI